MKIEKNSGEERLKRELGVCCPPGAKKGPPHCGKGEGKKTYLENEKMSRYKGNWKEKEKKMARGRGRSSSLFYVCDVLQQVNVPTRFD